MLLPLRVSLCTLTCETVLLVVFCRAGFWAHFSGLSPLCFRSSAYPSPTPNPRRPQQQRMQIGRAAAEMAANFLSRIAYNTTLAVHEMAMNHVALGAEVRERVCCFLFCF